MVALILGKVSVSACVYHDSCGWCAKVSLLGCRWEPIHGTDCTVKELALLHDFACAELVLCSRGQMGMSMALALALAALQTAA